MAEICGPCQRNLHGACRETNCGCNHDFQYVIPPDDEPQEVAESSKRERRHKPDAALKDQQSTGRKRAALQYPLDREAPCEWADASPTNPKGGGTKPITMGCENKVQEARHHGPDKNTLNNEPGNVHRICHWHHNNWHAMNDPDYQPGMLKAD